MHFGSRVQSVEECPADAHLEQVSCPRQEVWECPNLWHLKQRRGFEKRRRIPSDFQRTSLAGLALDSATSSGLVRAPSLQCRTPSRHHLELQDRRDYTPVDRAARTCWLGCPGLLYYLAA
ncbi:hypothetical protein TNCV_2238331 [Trichonephila clavipes]|nr:hypothetical protein TNCV_2238331 [Trichonephila clavipes]